jgi:hypothetical protein
MKKIEKLAGLLGLVLMTAFFVPYIVKLPQIDITLILLAGVVLAAYDFITSK